MKHFVKMVTPIFCALMLFTACDSTEIQSGPESGVQPSVDISSAKVARKDFLLTPPDQVPLDPSTDPPIQVSEIHSVPDFLNEEQQHIYRQACSIWGIFNGSMSTKHDLFLPEGTEHAIFETFDGTRYLKAQGRYRAWNDFTTMLHFIFTTEYTEVLLHMDADPPPYRIDNGNLYLINAAMGGNYGYDPPDEFELISENEKEIVFEIIGHYRSNSETWTAAFPASMVLTDNGWRFQEFGSPIFDEYEQ